MRTPLQITRNNFAQKTFAVLVVVAFIAFLLTLKPIAETVKMATEKLGIKFPPLDVFRNVANEIKNFAIYGIALLIGVAVGLVGLKVALIAVAVSGVLYAGYFLYNSLFKGKTQNNLPDNTPISRD